jgi:hypothetical protein
MQIDDSDEQNPNASFSMRESVQCDSNVTLESAPQSRKQRSQSSSTDAGMQIDESNMQSQNASFPMRNNLESASNVTLESERHP